MRPIMDNCLMKKIFLTFPDNLKKATIRLDPHRVVGLTLDDVVQPIFCGCCIIQLAGKSIDQEAKTNQIPVN